MAIKKEKVIFGAFLVVLASAVIWASREIYRIQKIKNETLTVLNKK